ncbi:acyltransferase family protein [Hyphomonas adhaerens]|uniref:acyltransferase family protein n=1 Tax=Hyphomonas adhaerens TaxID=81029 RepID=UPI002353B9F6|nr:acyltransferase family protein [Hyphomonas adhaerens]
MIKYRPEIDGLRAVAVVVVVLFHAALPIMGQIPFAGGFLGVDIFFVISGYLITSIILREATDQAFSYASFYERRARRILPALFVVILASIPFALWLMMPKALTEYAGSVLAALGFSSNIWFWLEDSYWAEPTQLKPFLHTWSLAVEEQFYLFFPPAILIIHRFARKYLTSLLALGLLASLALSMAINQLHKEAAFYLLPTRGWELLAGALLARFEQLHGRASHPILNSIMPSLGLFLILFGFAKMDEASPHPSMLTAIPILGVTLLIWFANRGEVITDILSSKPFVGVGKVSYSFYLWHFPVFAFARIKGLPETWTVMGALIALSFLLSVLSYFLVEQPMRNKRAVPLRPFAAVTGAVFMGLLGFFGYIYSKQGMIMVGDLPADLYANMEQVNAERAKYRENLSSTPLENFSDDKLSVVVIGNSFGRDVSYMFTFDDDVEVFYRDSTTPNCVMFTLPKPEAKDIDAARKRCAANEDIHFKQDYSMADAVILADNNSTWTIHPTLQDEIAKNIQTLRDYGFEGPILIYGERPQYTKEIFAILREFGTMKGADQFAEQYLKFDVPYMLGRVDRARKFYDGLGVYYYSPVHDLCGDNTWCRIVTPDGKVMYHDNDHFSLSGDQYLSPEIVALVRKLVAESDKTKAQE